NNGRMTPPLVGLVTRAWELARSGELRAAADAARDAVRQSRPALPAADQVELHLVRASCAMRLGDHADALRELDEADKAARATGVGTRSMLRVATWRAELAYFQGRYSDAVTLVDRLLPKLDAAGDLAYSAFALRIRIAILLARTDYDGIAMLANRALAVAEASGDDYVIVQILNVLGAVSFDRATSKLSGPHARAHLSSLDPTDTSAMEADAKEALRYFEAARAVAERAGYEFAAWYVAGNIERLQIVLGHADRAVRAIRKRLGVLQARGARYDEIVTRSNLAWGLRVLGQHREALHELDVALGLARETGTFNVLLEFLEYDRSIVLDALGDTGDARASYRRYLQLVGASSRKAGPSPGDARSDTPKRPLEPFYLKRADRYAAEHLGERFAVADLAAHCGVSWRTLEKAFVDFRGLTPVAHVRNLRLDQAKRLLDEGSASVAEIAARCGFRSSTTFALEYRKRFGIPPSRARRAAQA
ncbi:MAG TPA: helix-turn-helix transcriptional regulator, partial [Casimicrobiaceae bacterium]|nr:helix-turn-helix transcriptional regulator [Casimicrobiaceae bacterium]